MLEPSIDELQEQINSKYTLVTISARRARQLQDDSLPTDDDHAFKKYVGIALSEIKNGELFVKKK